MKKLHKQSVILVLKTLNLLTSKQFKKQLYSNIYNQKNLSLQQIQININVDLLRRLNDFYAETTKQDAVNYVLNVAEKAGIKIAKSDYKTIQHSIELMHYDLVMQFIYYDKAVQTMTSKEQMINFNLHNVLHELIDYKLVQNTIDNLDNSSIISKVINKLLQSKPVSFWKKGYIKDLFIHDRNTVYHDIQNKNILPAFFKTAKEYCSTAMVYNPDHTETEGDQKYFDLIKL